MKTKYTPNKVSVVATDDLSSVVSTLKKIEKRDGVITKRAVFEEARKRNSVLHKYYEWDIEKAAMSHWMEQSEKIIRAVAVTLIGDDGVETEPVRAFVAVHADDDETTFSGRGYISVARAMQSKNYRQQVVQDAYEELTSWRNRYESLKLFANVFAAIDQVPVPK